MQIQQSHSPNLIQSTRWLLKVLILGMILSSTRMEPCFAQIPRLIRYQGTLTDSAGILLDGTYDLTFRFYDKETGGTKMWEEIQTAVQVKSGALSVLLGKVTSLDLKFDVDCWLAVSVNGAAELSPRHRVASVPNAYLSDKAEGLVDVSARVYNSADVSISSDTWTAIPFSQERWDNGDLHDTVVNTTRLTAQTAGKYLIFGMIYWWPNDLGLRQMGIRLNNSPFLAAVLDRGISDSNNGNPAQSIATFYDLQAGDYVELQVKQNSGGSLSISTPEFAMEKIS